jgi:hypothetical protein
MSPVAMNDHEMISDCVREPNDPSVVIEPVKASAESLMSTL